MKEVGLVASEQTTNQDLEIDGTIVGDHNKTSKGIKDTPATMTTDQENVVDNIRNSNRDEDQPHPKIGDNVVPQISSSHENIHATHQRNSGEGIQELPTKVDPPKSVIFAAESNAGDLRHSNKLANMALKLTSNKFQVLSCPMNERDLEIRSEGVSDDEDGDAIPPKSDEEITKKKKRSSKRNIPPSDRLTRSVAKKSETPSNIYMSWLLSNIQGIH